MRREPGSTSRAVRHQAENAPRLAVTLYTTPRLVGRDVSRDTLVVDEAIHVLRTLATGPELAGGSPARPPPRRARARSPCSRWSAPGVVEPPVVTPNRRFRLGHL
jgi:hypothetical protein